MITATIVPLISFDGTDGRNSQSDLVADANGDLFGTAPGGANNDGVVFEVVNTISGYASTPTLLFTGDSSTNEGPYSLFVDSGGNLFGTSQNNETDSDGTVFEIANTPSGYAATPTVVANFNGTDGSSPTGALIADSAGDLFGTSLFDGANSNGTVFELVNTVSGYANTPTALVSLNDNGGFGFPNAGLVADAAGDLFGTTRNFSDVGSVFEVPFVNGSYASSATTLFTFDVSGDGSLPLGGLAIDSNGDLFGTAATDGSNTDGAVYEIPFVNGSYAAAPIILANFDGGDGQGPLGLIVNSAGDLFGTTSSGGANTDGTVFEVTNTGFVTCYRSGTRIATPAGERAVESLTEGDLVLTATGGAREIVWIGYRRVDCRRWDAPIKVWPVRVRAGAFGESLPHRDLFLSPDHAVFVGGALIPVRYLINGGGIAQMKVDEVVYYHIELAEHDLLLAEGLPAESYLDTGDRFVFENSSQVTRRPVHVALSWETGECASLLVTGPGLRELRRHIDAIAALPD